MRLLCRPGLHKWGIATWAHRRPLVPPLRGEERMNRLDRVLTAVDIACAIRDAALDRIRGPKCPTCWARTRNLPAHIAIDHAEVTG